MKAAAFLRSGPVLAAIGFGLAIANPAPAMTPQERREYRDKLVAILPEVPAFNTWLSKTDELPPDFDAMPRCNDLPDPLTFFDGRHVKSPNDWKARRNEIRQLFEKYAWGSIPPPPKLQSVDVDRESKADGYRTRDVRLHFGPDAKATMRVTLVIPDGAGPFPVLMGPGLVGGIFGGSGTVILRRGYIVASYAGNDANDDTRGLSELYPQFDFATLPRRAWAAGVVLDYLATLSEADMQRVGIYGYSRDGKQAVIAAALDERIAAVIAGSTGVGGVLPYRLAGERNQAEGIESTTRMFPDWFSPRLRFFAGREDRLPVDGNLLPAMIAPRACLMLSGFNDEVSNTWGDEQSLHSAAKVYPILNAPAERLGLLRIPGFHGAGDMEKCLDFLDIQFGRSKRTWKNEFVFPWNYDQWKEQAQKPEPIKHGEQLTATLKTMLGTPPPLMPPATGRSVGGRGPTTGPAPNPGQVRPDLVNWVIQRSLGGSRSFGWLAADANQTVSRPLRFGYNVRGDLYFPKDAPDGAKLPVVIWLHSYSYPLGYMWVYHEDLHPVLALVKSGYAVLAFDQSGFGARMEEAGPFYDRWPRWSMMGRMVEDVSAAIGALQKDARVDPERIYLFGYSLGGNVALHAAALDPRIKGVISVCGFTPMRTDTAAKGAGGIARFSVERPLIPRLGMYIGNESAVPYDFDDLIGAISPRPVYVLQPQLDRDATPADVRAAVEKARQAFVKLNAQEKLLLDEPWDYNRLPTVTQDRIIAWMKIHMK